MWAATFNLLPGLLAEELCGLGELFKSLCDSVLHL